MGFTHIYKIRIVYKSGYCHDFDAYSFSFKNGSYSWEAVSNNNKPILLGVDDIAAIYQVGMRKAFRFTSK